MTWQGGARVISGLPLMQETRRGVVTDPPPLAGPRPWIGLVLGDTCLYTCEHADGACRRPFLIQSGGAVTLIGLDITGGYSCRDEYVRHVLNFLRPCLYCVR